MERKISASVQTEDADTSLKHFLRVRLGLTKQEISRAKFRDGGICVNGERKKVNAKVAPGDYVEVLLEEGNQSSPRLSSVRVPFSVLYEDCDVLVVDKPSGILTHPRGGSTQTLANGLAAFLRERGEDSVIRIVGRLDKDTSGAVLAVKNRAAGFRLARQREQGLFFKTYLALAVGVPKESSGWIRTPIGADQEHRGRMKVLEEGKPAATWYEVMKVREDGISLLRLRIETGRTHQIRVHMASVGCPLLGDPLYGGKVEGLFGADSTVPAMGRTALHAAQLSFLQPFTGERIEVAAPLPADMGKFVLPDSLSL